MNTWTPLWSQVVDSSLWEEKPSVRVLFVTMLALKDADHICRYDAYKLHKKANLTPEETKEALRILQNPDTRRKAFEQEFDGRRIQQVEQGWLILNGEKYRSMIQKMKQREYKTIWQSEKRAKDKQVTLTGGEAVEFLEAKEKSFGRRVKVARHAGKRSGASEAIKVGLASENGNHG